MTITSSKPLESKASQPIEQIIERIFSSRRITRSDQHRFMSALLSKDSLSEKEQLQINRVFDSLRQGLLKVAD